MRRTFTTRLGASGLTLLMQVFVVSSLLHPCCLTGDMGAEGVAAHGHAPSVVTPAASAHASGADAHGTAAHGGHEVGAEAPITGAHQGHAGHGGSDDSECEGRCGFCCQVAGFAGLPAPPMAGISAAEIAASPARFPLAEVRAFHTAYLASWANAPPVRFDIV